MLNIKEPAISNIEKKEVLNCLKYSEISTYGKLVKNIGSELSFYSGAKYNLPLNSGSASLLLGLKSVGIIRDDIVITQSFTFGATVHAIINSQASPWLFDIDKETLSIDTIKLQKVLEKKTFFKNGYTFLKKNKKRVYAICPVTSFGVIPNLIKIKKIAHKYNLKIVIDGACAFGNKHNKEDLIKFADVVVYSFNGNKNFTSGGGGALSTNDKKIYDKAKVLSDNGKSKGTYIYSLAGHNYKMTNLHAAILKGQLSRYSKIRKKIFLTIYCIKKKLKILILNFLLIKSLVIIYCG